MAQKQMLKDRNTGVDIFPVTHESCVVTDDGSGVATKDELANLQETINMLTQKIDDILSN